MHNFLGCDGKNKSICASPLIPQDVGGTPIAYAAALMEQVSDILLGGSTLCIICLAHRCEKRANRTSRPAPKSIPCIGIGLMQRLGDRGVGRSLPMPPNRRTIFMQGHWPEHAPPDSPPPALMFPYRRVQGCLRPPIWGLPASTTP